MRFLNVTWKVALFFILWSTIFAISPKLWGIFNLLGGGYLFYSLFLKNTKFKNRKKVTRVTVGTLLVFYTIFFTAMGFTYNEEEVLV